MPTTGGERYGFSTSRGFRRAVDRNRARRRLGEAFRSVYRPGPRPVALVGTATPESLTLPYPELKAHVAGQLRELHLQVREHGGQG
jgi:ribonuclease P protein component